LRRPLDRGAHAPGRGVGARGLDLEVGARRVAVGELRQVLRHRVRLRLAPRLEPHPRPRTLLGAPLPRLLRLRHGLVVAAGGRQRLGLVAQPEARAPRPRRERLRHRGAPRLLVEEARDRQARLHAHEELGAREQDVEVVGMAGLHVVEQLAALVGVAGADEVARALDHLLVGDRQEARLALAEAPARERARRDRRGHRRLRVRAGRGERQEPREQQGAASGHSFAPRRRR
jgi:hypothetical protein